MVFFHILMLYGYALCHANNDLEYIPPDSAWLMEQPGWQHNANSIRIYDDFDTYPFVQNSLLAPLVVYPHWKGSYNQTNTNKVANFSAFAAQINDNTKLSFQVPNTACSIRQTVSKTASEKQCIYATNGGFFSFSSPYCLPQLISDGTPVIIQQNSNTPKTAIGLDWKNHELAIGYINLNNSNVNNYHELLSGSGWLIRNGAIYVNKSIDIDVTTQFVQEKAPRTGLGVWKNGSMVMLQVDGEEDIKYGMDLWEFAKLFMRLGVDSALNLDGGGSSTSVYENKVIDYPTCFDNSTKCERDVTSIVCVQE